MTLPPGALSGLEDLLPASDTVDVPGPRVWWGGGLDVEGLALGSVELALLAASACARAFGRRVELTSHTQAIAAAFGSLNRLRVDGRAPEGFAPLSGFFRTADGWVRLHANYPHHEAALRRAVGLAPGQGPRELSDALASAGADEVEQALRAAGGVGVAVRSPQVWAATAMGQVACAGDWIEVAPPGSASGGGSRRRRRCDADADAPLAGVRVLDLTRVIAGPTGSMFLASLGADVLRLDPPWHPELPDQHLGTGWGKRTARANLADPGAAQAVHELLDAADVLLTAYRPGSLAAFGLEAPVVAERHPGVVTVSLSAWGTSGPWGGQRGFDSIVQAATGIAHVQGRGEGDGWRPGALPVQALDHASGYGMAAAALALLAGRDDRGAGSARLSLARTAHALLASGPPGGSPRAMEAQTVVRRGAAGALEHVPPPVWIDGVRADPAPPRPLGQDPLEWIP